MTFGEKKEMEMKREETVIRNSSEEKSKFESFLGKQMLRVLLVEPDDSTRHIYALLLRNCNYRVTAVSDGLKAWETLKGRPHDVDLILTEVELPSISGYPLLTLIMEHDICKNIPVIMMSSKDSISLVLKCMLKGAVDFLIKPIRKSKLKNLWQHVWRRQINESRNVPECKDVALEKVGDDRANDYTTCAKRKKPCLRKNCSDSQTCFDTPYLEAETVVLNSPSNIGEHEESAMPESDSVGIASGAIDLIRNLNCCHEGLDDDTKKVNVSPDLKLSLKWMEPNDDRETLCHSKSSAFSTWSSNYQQSPAFSTSVSAKTQENLPTFVLGQSGISEAPFTPIPVGYGYLYPPVYYMPLWNQKLHHEDSSFPTSSSVVHSTNLEQVHHSEDGKRLETERATSHRAPAHDLSSMKGENHVVIARPSESVNDKNHVLVHDGQQGKDSHTITPREAALIKFRLKRKDRCFEKKVRYQSRKRLADQRVRVKGQFIRQFPTENLPLEVNDRP